MDTPTGHHWLTHRQEPVESWMRRESHVQFGRRTGETGQRKRWNRAPVRPNTLAMLAYAFLAVTAAHAPKAAATWFPFRPGEIRRLLGHRISL